VGWEGTGRLGLSTVWQHGPGNRAVDTVGWVPEDGDVRLCVHTCVCVCVKPHSLRWCLAGFQGVQTHPPLCVWQGGQGVHLCVHLCYLGASIHLSLQLLPV
jgi:hypothetical protein